MLLDQRDDALLRHRFDDTLTAELLHPIVRLAPVMPQLLRHIDDAYGVLLLEELGDGREVFLFNRRQFQISRIDICNLFFLL